MSGRARDRDSGGRPRNARARDPLGRPLPRGADGSDATTDPVGSPMELLAQGAEHFNAERFFQAHECWETAWHPSPEPEREFWQGITQIAVGLTHRQRGNLNGAIRLLRRGAERAASYGDRMHGLAVGTLVDQARLLADALEREGLGARMAPPRADLLPR